MPFAATRLASLPALAWAAEIDSDLGVSAMCGKAVEVDDQGLIAGAWTGPFGERGIHDAVASVGTALKVGGDGILVHCGTAGNAPVFFCRNGDRLVVSNSLSLALAAADDRLDMANPYYFIDLCTYLYGSDRYRPTVRTERGTLSMFYGAMSVGPGRRISPAPTVGAPRFDDYHQYRTYLVEQTALLFANAADKARRQPYRPLATVSSGYDSSASAVIAHAAGCREGITFGECLEAPDRPDDSGADIGARIGLDMSEYRTFAYRERDDLPEVEFIASGVTSGQVFLAGTEAAIGGRLIVSGIGGDFVWDPRNARTRRSQGAPFFIGGYSEVEFLLRAPALSLALPMIGVRRMNQLDRLGTSPAMRDWSVGGDYDRPIPRRIVEETGVPRGAFADMKRRVAGDFFNFARRTRPLDVYLSRHSLEAFEAWLDSERPMARAPLRRHALVADSVGRLIWSGKLDRLLSRTGLSWPPARHRFLRYRVPISKNCYVFNWAVGLQTERYRDMLAQR
jgi:hypothetical protein